MDPRTRRSEPPPPEGGLGEGGGGEGDGGGGEGDGFSRADYTLSLPPL